MPELSADPRIEATPVVGGDNRVVDDPTLMLRPRLVFRLLGPTLLVVGGLGVAAGFLPAAFVALVGIAMLIAWVQRISVNEREIVIRGLTASTRLPIASIDEVRLRRVPFGPRHGLRRTFRFGPFSSTPIRLRFLHAEETLGQITIMYWDGWAGLARYLLAVPTIDCDSRTRGRLERYG